MHVEKPCDAKRKKVRSCFGLLALISRAYHNFSLWHQEFIKADMRAALVVFIPHKALPLVCAADHAQTFVVWSLGTSPPLQVKVSTSQNQISKYCHSGLGLPMKPTSTHILPVHKNHVMSKRKKMGALDRCFRLVDPHQQSIPQLISLASGVNKG